MNPEVVKMFLRKYMFLDFAYFSVGLGEDEGGGRVRSSVHASQVL